MHISDFARLWIVPVLFIGISIQACNVTVASADEPVAATATSATLADAQRCRKCHEDFYKHWATSRHGLAVQPYTTDFARKILKPQRDAITIGEHRYRADISPEGGHITEHGPDGEKQYPIKRVMGGKNVCYFLTPMESGRLQILPVGYDVRKQEWFDTTGNGVPHIVDSTDKPVEWTDRRLTFGTSCHACHVSQLTLNFDEQTDTYDTTLKEPGIACETCHGTVEEHIRVCRAAPAGTVAEDLKIVKPGSGFTVRQNNDTCGSCHAKSIPLTKTYDPGKPFFDHFDLIALESSDFYPDGRGLRDTYTVTSWRMSPCVKSGKLDCLHCHTLGGRYKYPGEKTNHACLPCHESRVKNSVEHSKHKPDSPGNTCVGCHMPTREVARVRRTDHSMLPPTPAATIRFKSPNACTSCHTDKTAVWANKLVRKWRESDYQAPVLHRAGLIAAAREGDWSQLDEMLAYLSDSDRDEIFATSLLRLMRSCRDEAKWLIFMKLVTDPSPMVRSAACRGLTAHPEQTVRLLIEALSDDLRLVRVKAAQALVRFRPIVSRILDRAPDKEKLEQRLTSTTQEMFDVFLARPDQWHAHYRVGNFFFNSGRPDMALEAYKTALKLDPDAVPVLVNMAMSYGRLGKTAQAEEQLKKALAKDPDNAVAHFNTGLLKAEQNQNDAAIEHLSKALEEDPEMHQAAFNLGVLLSRTDPETGILMLLKAYDLNPVPKYGMTAAVFMRKRGDAAGAEKMLMEIIESRPDVKRAYDMLSDLYIDRGESDKALEVYKKGLQAETGAEATQSGSSPAGEHPGSDLK